MKIALVFVHGRGQEMPVELRADAARVTAEVASKKRKWLGGLAKGLVLAGGTPVPEAAAYFPYYANALADAIAAHEAAGGAEPDLEIPGTSSKDEMILEAAAQLGFRPEVELAIEDPELAAQTPASQLELAAQAPAASLEFPGVPFIRVPVVRAALQFISRKTGVPDWVIERYLTDVGYYLTVSSMRELVFTPVRQAIAEAAEVSDELVVVGHSLGSVVAYDTLQDLPHGVTVRLFVTAGSPLGFPAVQRHLAGVKDDNSKPGVPARRRGDDQRLEWVNAFDVRDVVALIHPLNGTFHGGAIRDERTFNPSGPHSIEDYLADPDVARPIGSALA
jgi:hypothetical protein